MLATGTVRSVTALPGMALTDKLKIALDETRLLILGSQILFGFQLNAMFQDGFAELSAVARDLNVCGVLLMASVRSPP